MKKQTLKKEKEFWQKVKLNSQKRIIIMGLAHCFTMREKNKRQFKMQRN
jgi:hypothetical protein